MKSNNQLNRDEQLYCPNYCEENTYQFLKKINLTNDRNIDNFYAVYISSVNKLTPVWFQKSNKKDDSVPVIWDYHVITIQKDSSSIFVYDFDSKLPFPCDGKLYAIKSFGYQFELKSEYHQ